VATTAFAPVSRFRLSRDGTRQVNAALHRIAITQVERWSTATDA
jgi:hypothetical protein